MVCSVDPPGCKDIDDALHARPLPGGNLELGVHIADVTHFLEPGSAMDDEAAARCARALGAARYETLRVRRATCVPGSGGRAAAAHRTQQRIGVPCCTACKPPAALQSCQPCAMWRALSHIVHPVQRPRRSPCTETPPARAAGLRASTDQERKGSERARLSAGRATTTYLVQRRIDMLPKPLTEDICSLRAGGERLAFSVIWELTPDAQPVAVRFTKSVIRRAGRTVFPGSALGARLVAACNDKRASGGLAAL